MTKQEFVDALNGNAAKIKEAFKAGYDAGFSDGGLGDEGFFDLDDEWKWYKEKIAEDDNQDGTETGNIVLDSRK